MFLPMGMWFTIVIFLLGIPGDPCAEIIGGKESVPHSRPFMAKIKNPSLCGGTLITPNWVLTAAHCKITKDTEVILGIHSESERIKQVFKVQRNIPHEGYNRFTKENDIMLLQLNKQAQLNKNVATVKFPQMYSDLKPGTQCLVAGWGITKDGIPIPSDVLREVNVTVIARDICSDYYNYNPKVTMNMVCAGNERGGKDSCAGDSGGPLVCNGVQRGIVACGRHCGRAQCPGIYTFLTPIYFDWMKRVIKRY